MAHGVLNREDLNNIILGAHFYASGGGGALKNGQALLDRIDDLFKEKSNAEVRVKYIDIDEVKDEDWLPVLAAMGAPEQFLKKGYGSSPITSFEALEDVLKKEFSALSPVETGAIAYGMSLLVAAHKKIPIINGDGGGRAFPCLQLSTFANPQLNAPIPVSPCVLTSEDSLKDDGGVLTIQCNSSSDVDAMTRAIISESTSFDQRASLSSFAMKGSQLKQDNAAVPDMLMKAKDLGKNIKVSVQESGSCFDVIDRLPGAQCVMKGRLVSITDKTENGFDWGVQEYQSDDGDKYFVISQNENLLLWSDNLGTPIAMAPDSICCFSSDASLISNDEIMEVWETTPTDYRLRNMAIYTLNCAKQIDQKWFHDNFSEIFKKFNYFGDYHSPIKVTK